MHHHAIAAHDGHADGAKLARFADERVGQIGMRFSKSLIAQGA